MLFVMFWWVLGRVMNFLELCMIFLKKCFFGFLAVIGGVGEDSESGCIAVV